MREEEKPQVRPAFRRMAAGVAIACFILAAVFGLARPEDGLFAPGVCMAVGVLMAVISVRGRWPLR